MPRTYVRRNLPAPTYGRVYQRARRAALAGLKARYPDEYQELFTAELEVSRHWQGPRRATLTKREG